MSHRIHSHRAHGVRRLHALVLALAGARRFAPRKAEPAAPPAPNYDLAAQWTSQKVGKLVFDTSVTPRWLETSDRFWYAYRTREGRRFLIVDPIKKTKAPLFDHAKMAATLTSITRLPYDAQHLPFSNVRFVKKDTAIEFDVQVPADAGDRGAGEARHHHRAGEPRASRRSSRRRRQPDEAEAASSSERGQAAAGASARPAPRTRTLHFEYDLATARVSLLEDDPHNARLPRWASLSPDEKTVVFSRKDNLFMMDADNFAKALKKADDTSIVEVQLTTDGEEHYSYGRTAARNPEPARAGAATAAATAGGRRRQQQDEERDMDRSDRPHAGRQPDLVARLEQVRAGAPRFAQGDGPVGDQCAGARRARRSRRIATRCPARRTSRSRRSTSSIAIEAARHGQGRSLHGSDACRSPPMPQRNNIQRDPRRPDCRRSGSATRPTSCISRASAATSTAWTSSWPTPRPAR